MTVVDSLLSTDIGHQAETPPIYLSAPYLDGDELPALEKVLHSGWVASNGPMVYQFEQKIAEITGFRHAVATVSCTAALKLAARVLNVSPGDEVWCPTLTFIASIGPFIEVGAIPRFIDVDIDTWTLDLNILSDSLRTAARTGRLPKVVIATDLYGNPCDVQAITKACSLYGVSVVVDAAASLGSKARGCHASWGARIACMSFNGNKIVTTGGGGVLLTDDEALAIRARRLGAQAREPSVFYDHRTLGYGYLISNVSAAIGVAQLGSLDQRVALRRTIFQRYYNALTSLSGLQFQIEPSWAQSNRWLTVISFDHNWSRISILELCRHLKSLGIEVRPIWRPLHLQPALSGAPRAGGQEAEKIAKRGLCLPSGNLVTEKRQSYIISCLLEALHGKV